MALDTWPTTQAAMLHEVVIKDTTATASTALQGTYITTALQYLTIAPPSAH